MLSKAGILEMGLAVISIINDDDDPFLEADKCMERGSPR